MTTRFDVRSADGTRIAVWGVGEGPPLVMVHGALSDHTNDQVFAGALAPRLTVFGMDRRGRGASGDATGYSIEREFEDVAAVVDEVAVRTGQAVAVWGHSYGADCVMGGATLTRAVSRLVLYEPGLGMIPPKGSVEAMEEALAAGDDEQAAVALLSRVVLLSPEEIAFTRALPTWQARIRIVPTVPRELTAESGWVYSPGQFDGVEAPALVLSGSESPGDQQSASVRAAAALPNATIRVLDGHAHIAHRTDPSLVAAIVLDFIDEEV